MRPHGHARADRNSPSAWAVCDDCGFLYNKRDLAWQYEWFGPRTQRVNFLKCQRCLDVPQEQLRTFVLPADPVPVPNPRPEATTLDNPITTINTGPIGTLTQGAGLAAAFDGNTNKPMFLCANLYVSLAGTTNSIGASWVGLFPNNSGAIASAFTVYGPNDARIFGGGATPWVFQGSNDKVFWTTIALGSTVGGKGEIIIVNLVPTTNYLFHQFVLTGDGINSVSVAQLQISCTGIGSGEL